MDQSSGRAVGWTEKWRPMMETVLFTDHCIVVFAIVTGALALIFSVLGLATTSQTRSDIKHQLGVR